MERRLHAERNGEVCRSAGAGTRGQSRFQEESQKHGERCMGIQPCAFLWALATCNCLFRFPETELDSLLQEWETHMRTPEHKAHVRRTCLHAYHDAHAADEHRAAKFECHRLRNRLRRARKDDRDINEGKLDVNSMSWRRWGALQEFRSGALARKTDEATRKRGFGLIRTGTPTSLNAPSFVRDR